MEIGKPGEVNYSPYKYEIRSGNYGWGAVSLLDAETLEAAGGV